MSNVQFQAGNKVALTPQARVSAYSYVKERFDGHDVTVEDVVDSHPERGLRTGPNDFVGPTSGQMARLKNEAGQVWYTNVGNLERLMPTPLHFSVQEMLALSTVPGRGQSATLNESGQDLAVKRPDVREFFQSPVQVLDVVAIDPRASFSTIATLQNDRGELRELPTDYIQRA